MGANRICECCEPGLIEKDLVLLISITDTFRRTAIARARGVVCIRLGNPSKTQGQSHQSIRLDPNGINQPKKSVSEGWRSEHQ